MHSSDSQQLGCWIKLIASMSTDTRQAWDLTSIPLPPTKLWFCELIITQPLKIRDWRMLHS